MQLTFDSLSKTEFKIDKPVRLIELFAGIGAISKALSRLGVDFEHYRAVDFSKYKNQAYNAVHDTDFTPLDITKITGADLGIVDTKQFLYILSYTYPCQDLSNAGKRQGMKKESGTRSSLVWEVQRLLNESAELPQVLIMENVTQVHDYQNKDCFIEWISFLESKGYSNNYADLNASDYGIPQNRARCFMVSLLGEYYYTFPEPIELTETLEDRLEKDVSEDYYLSDENVKKILASTFNQQRDRIQNRGGVSRTLCARDWKDPPCVKDG